MGTWSVDAFGNDAACDWAHELVAGEDSAVLEKAVQAVIPGRAGYLEAPDAEFALAAIDVLARLRGHPGERNAYTAKADEWVHRTRLVPSTQLVSAGLAAIDRILGDDSELKDLWEESDQAAAWTANVRDLKERLRAEPRPLDDGVRDGDGGSSAPAPESDPVATLLARIGEIGFIVPSIAEQAPLTDLLKVVHAGGALDAIDETRDAIHRMWEPVTRMGKDNILWDLAVREAQTWAAQGHLDDALAGLEAWRGSPTTAAAGEFESRASGVCLTGADAQRARDLRAAACAAAPDSALGRIDRALLEARLGSAELAQEILAREDLKTLPPEFGLYFNLIRGILACRSSDPAAMGLLTQATQGFLDRTHGSPAGWGMLAIVGGWWAVSLAQSGRRQEAASLAASLAPILMLDRHRPLLALLQERNVLPAAALGSIRSGASAGTAGPATAPIAAPPAGWKVMRARGVNALQWVHRKRREFAAGSGWYPFLIGDDRDYDNLLQQVTPPADGGQADIAAGRALDVDAWIAKHASRSSPRWPKDELSPHPTPLAQFDTLSQRLKQEMLIALVELDDPSELFARIGFGGWNGCPEPHIHVALHAYWRARHGAEPLVVQAGTVECILERPVTEKADALALAREHRAYCDDIVEQGTGTTAKLASSLRNAKYWYFWWD